MSQAHLEMCMMIKINGPGSWNAEQAGYAKDECLESAYRKFMERSARRIAADRVAIMAEGSAKEQCKKDLLAEADVVFPEQPGRYKWGKGYDHTPQFDKDENAAKEQATANHRRRMEAANDGNGGEPEAFRIKSLEGEEEVERECVVDLGTMTVVLGDEVACTGFGGTVWYSGRVGAEERKGKKPMWVVYFGSKDKTYTRMPLDPKNYGKAVELLTAPGEPKKWKAGWMFLIPTTESDGLVLKSQASLGLDQ